MNLRRPFGQQAVPGHGEEDARLAQQHDQHHGCQAEDRADLHQQRAPAHARCVNAQRHWIGDIQQLVVHQAGQHGGDQDVEDGADHQRTEDADRHIPLRILGFLGRRGNSVEADVREKDGSCGLAESRPNRSCRAHLTVE